MNIKVYRQGSNKDVKKAKEDANRKTIFQEDFSHFIQIRDFHRRR